MITILIGKSAAGKDYFLKNKIREGANPIVSYTTRPMRPGEEDGKDYNFVTKDEFKDLEKKCKLLESRTYNTLVDNKPDVWFYGSPVVDPTRSFIVVLDPKGAYNYICQYGPANVEVIYITADDDIRTSRAIKRSGLNKDEWERSFKPEWERRLEDDKKVFSPEAIKKLEEKLGRKIITIINN